MRIRPALSRALVALAIATPLLGAPVPAVAAPPAWVQDIEATVAGHDVSVAVGFDGGWMYRRAARTARTPASNEKLLFSMAMLDRMPLWTRIRTQSLATRAPAAGILRGDLWIVGHGDPEIDRFRLRRLARAIEGAGIHRIRGRVMGATTGFQRDWWAPGWRDYFPDVYIPLPTALTFDRNQDRSGRHIIDPERRAAGSLTKRLEASGVPVRGDPGAGPRPAGLRLVATIRSAPLETLVLRMNRGSKNFHAEVLGKWLGGRVIGGPGSIAKGARVIESFGRSRGVEIVAHDASGLSYANRVRPLDVVRLLWFADARAWGNELRFSLPRGNQGTLEGRLGGVKVRAKTGTLIDISTLSGWVWLEKIDDWAEFSIMSAGMSKAEASAIEDRIVRIVSNRATP